VTPAIVHPVTSSEIEDALPGLIPLLAEAVNGGASLGFLPPVTPAECRRYWLSLRNELRGGSRLLFGAYLGDRLIGSGQLALPSWPNARHRAEVQKLLVAAESQGRGVGERLLREMHG
jgi:acetyltransferase